MASTGGLFVNLISTYDESGLKKADASLKGTEGNLDSFKLKANAAFAAAGVAAVAYASKLLVEGVQAAAEDEKAQIKLATALRNVTSATDSQIAAVEDYILQTSLATGVTDGELRPSFEKLLVATEDVTKAQELQNLALDVAAGSGKSLETVSMALSKAYNGNLGALTKLGIPLSENILKTKDFDAAASQLAATFGGQASAQAGTFEGKMQILQTTIDEAKESVGALVLDALQPLLTKLMELVGAWNNLSPGMQNAIMVFGLAGVAIIGTVTAVVKMIAIFNTLKATYAVITAAQISLNLAMLTNPIFLVVAAVVALIGIFVLAYKNIDGFRALVDTAFESIKNAIMVAFNWVKENWPLLLGILTGPIGLAVLTISKNWDKVTGFFETFLTTAKKIFKNVANAITGPFRAAFNSVADYWNKTIGKFKIEIPDWVPIVGGKVFEFPKMPKIPELAEGGIVKARKGGMLALIGEGGRDEAVIPLPKGKRMDGLMGGGITINVHGALDPEAVARQIQTILTRSKLRAGAY